MISCPPQLWIWIMLLNRIWRWFPVHHNCTRSRRHRGTGLNLLNTGPHALSVLPNLKHLPHSLIIIHLDTGSPSVPPSWAARRWGSPWLALALEPSSSQSIKPTPWQRSGFDNFVRRSHTYLMSQVQVNMSADRVQVEWDRWPIHYCSTPHELWGCACRSWGSTFIPSCNSCN